MRDLDAALHTADAWEIWIDQSGFSRREKIWCPRQGELTGKALKSGNFSHWRWYEVFTKGDFQFPKPYYIAKGEKYETSCVSKLLIWRQIVVRRAWPCRIIVVLFWTKCAVRRQIKPGILYLIVKRGQSNFTIVFILASSEEKGYFPVVSVERLIFDCRMYCGLSRRMQGASSVLGHVVRKR